MAGYVLMMCYTGWGYNRPFMKKSRKETNGKD